MRAVLLTDNCEFPHMIEIQQYRHPLLWGQFSGGLCKRNMFWIRHVANKCSAAKRRTSCDNLGYLNIEQLLGHAKWASAASSNTFSG